MAAKGSDAEATPTTTSGDTTATPTPEALDVLTREVWGSVESYRKQGQVFVSVLAAIPTATLVTTLIRAPSDAGLHEARLAFGLLFAFVALGLGVVLALSLRKPVEVTENELKTFSMQRIIGTGQQSY